MGGHHLGYGHGHLGHVYGHGLGYGHLHHGYHYGKRSADAEPEADAYYGYGHGLAYGHYPVVSTIYGHSHHAYPYAYGHGYHYGKREAEAEPTAAAEAAPEADAYYGHYFLYFQSRTSDGVTPGKASRPGTSHFLPAVPTLALAIPRTFFVLFFFSFLCLRPC